jgi:hypothetical protein
MEEHKVLDAIAVIDARVHGQPRIHAELPWDEELRRAYEVLAKK